MVRRAIAPARSLLFNTITVLFFLSSAISAQNLPKLPGGGNGAAASSSEAAASSTTKGAKQKATSSAKGSTTTNAAAATSDMPGLTGLPKLAGDNYPPPTVPPTADAPFMQKSNLPEGTVFIAVGAGLGFIFALVLAWRGFMAWSVHQSVKRAAVARIAQTSAGTGGGGNGGQRRSGKGSRLSAYPYTETTPGSAMTMDPLGPGGDSKTSAAAKHASARASLFFSPTAGAGANVNVTGGANSGGNRTSTYLPAGYYNAGNTATAAGGASKTHIGSGLAGPAANRRYSQVPAGRSPSPGRPLSMPPGQFGGATDSSAAGNRTSMGKAPTAVLDDMFSNSPPTQSSRDAQRSSRRF